MQNRIWRLPKITGVPASEAVNANTAVATHVAIHANRAARSMNAVNAITASLARIQAERPDNQLTSRFQTASVISVTGDSRLGAAASRALKRTFRSLAKSTAPRLVRPGAVARHSICREITRTRTASRPAVEAAVCATVSVGCEHPEVSTMRRCINGPLVPQSLCSDLRQCHGAQSRFWRPAKNTVVPASESINASTAIATYVAIHANRAGGACCVNRTARTTNAVSCGPPEGIAMRRCIGGPLVPQTLCSDLWQCHGPQNRIWWPPKSTVVLEGVPRLAPIH